MAAGKKPAAKRREPGVPIGIWVLLGLMVALLVAVLIVLLLKTPPQGGGASQGAGDSRVEDTRDVRKDAPEKPVTAPRYEFYHLLPEESAPRPPAEAPPAAEPDESTAVPEAPAADAGRFLLQVGAFRSRSDAERRKAEVALLGFSSQVQEARVEERMIYRVVIGPLDGEAVTSAERQLQAAAIEPLRRRLP
ncbi:MAG: SPOR domain-containing protein [Halothiobacillaceae bacterium]